MAGPTTEKARVGAAREAVEHAAYVEHAGAQLYCVRHVPGGPPRARVLLAGPVAGERERAYLTMVHWARRLAREGCEVLRFDYRGLGESTGNFEALTLDDWTEDVAAAARLLPGRAPLVLHGIRFGALPAAELFAAGLGDALLLWAAPASARDHLWELMRRNLFLEMVLHPGRAPKTREAYAAELEAGRRVNVDGYVWTPRLWADSKGRTLRRPCPPEPRPWRQVDAGGVARFWEAGARLLPDVAALFDASAAWLADVEPAP